MIGAGDFMQVFLVCMLAGIAAGVEIGFAGVSAPTIIAPVLIACLGYPWYEAVGIGLTAEVLSAVSSAYVYKKNKNVDLKGGTLMVSCVLIFTFIGSYFSQYLPNTEMGWITIILSLVMGLRFVLSPTGNKNQKFIEGKASLRVVLSILVGCYIGFWCGLLGAGGGMMMLFGLTCVLGYELKMAVGTSGFVMVFTALIGAVSHFYYGEMTDYIPAVIICSIFTLLAASVSARLANRMSAVKTSYFTGTILLVLCGAMIIKLAVGL
ncbi:MAG: sulfite exporter TauE/SafE family protein [Clostridiales bacterium]|nr:sulfite exporter TauE/SafE family protein [Clostridiales bacterium]